MKAVHTPGPWHISPTAGRTHRTVENQNEGYGAYAIALIPEDVDSDYTPETTTANARLIAASPELLAALENAVEQYGKPGGPWNVPSHPGTWIADAQAAIAKAVSDA